MDTSDFRELPDDVEVPDYSIATEDMYRHMYTVVSTGNNLALLRKLAEDEVPLDDLWAETDYDELIDAGLAGRQSGAGYPYIKITSLGKAFVENGPEGGVRKLVQEEKNIKDTYSSK